MAILRDRGEVLALTGIPLSHMDAFQRVADGERCVIMSRSVGTSCTQLIEESYSSKGFHVKAKSCDWGPMAGFVLADPNLTKRAPDEFGKQKSDLEHAFKDWGAASTPLYISDARRRKLLADGTITRRGGDDRAMVVSGNQKGNGDQSDRVLRRYFFKLEQVPGKQLENAPAPIMYAVKYISPDKALHVGGGEGDHVHAMVNPAGLGGRAPGVRAALTGDYDLFSVAVHRDLYRPGTGVDGQGNFNRGKDARMISVPGLEQNIDAKLPDVGEDTHMGNMSGRLRELRDKLNQQFRLAGYLGGNMVHHSDESGRPFVRDVDLEVFAVVPGQKRPYGLKSLADIREFFMEVGRYGSYVPMLNPGWMSELVFNRRGFDAKSLVTARKALRPVKP